MSDDSGTTAELDELEKRLREMRGPNVWEAADALAALRRERDALRERVEAGIGAAGLRKYQINELRAACAKKDAALREAINLLKVLDQLGGLGFDKHGWIKKTLAEIIPASQEAEHIADAGKMVSPAPQQGSRPCPQHPGFECWTTQCLAGDCIAVPASPSPGHAVRDLFAVMEETRKWLGWAERRVHPSLASYIPRELLPCVPASPSPGLRNHRAAHLIHCYQDEYAGECKYGDPDCPAKEPQP